MERLVKAGKIEEVYYARLIPGEDILQAIYEICAEHEIKTGVILDGSGAGADFTYQHFPLNKAFIDPDTKEFVDKIKQHLTSGTNDAVLNNLRRSMKR